MLLAITHITDFITKQQIKPLPHFQLARLPVISPQIITVFYTMNTTLNGDLCAGDAGRPVQLTMIGIDVSIGAADQLSVDVALTLTNTCSLAGVGQRAFMSLHAVVGQTRI